MSPEQLHGTQVPPQRGSFGSPPWSAPRQPLADPQPTSRSRRWRRRTGLFVAFLVVFVLGVMAGVGDTTAQEERDRAREQLTVAESQILTLRGRADEAASLQQRLTAAEADVAQLREDAATAASTSTRLTSDLQAAQAEVARLDGEVTRLQAELGAARAESAAAPVTSQTLSSTGSAPAPRPGSSSASYANCSEARAAGAAPLYRGDTGYAAKLDRDDDGVACE